MKIDFVTAVKLFFSKYATFKGRATRAEYWWVALFCFLVSLVCQFLGSFGAIVVCIFSLAVLVPSIALTVRRLHDIGLSGWVYAIYLLIGLALGAWFFIACGDIYVALLRNPETVTPEQISSLGSAALPVVICGAILGILFLVFMVRKSGPDNKYGPNPFKAPTI